MENVDTQSDEDFCLSHHNNDCLRLAEHLENDEEELLLLDGMLHEIFNSSGNL